MIWTVEPITKKQADLIVTARHYSRRAPVFWEAFALVEDGFVEGVVVYGQRREIAELKRRLSLQTSANDSRLPALPATRHAERRRG